MSSTRPNTGSCQRASWIRGRPPTLITCASNVQGPRGSVISNFEDPTTAWEEGTQPLLEHPYNRRAVSVVLGRYPPPLGRDPPPLTNAQIHRCLAEGTMFASVMATDHEPDGESRTFERPEHDMTVFGHRFLHQPLSQADYVSLVNAARRYPHTNVFDLARERGLLRRATEIIYYGTRIDPEGRTVGQLYLGRSGSVEPSVVQPTLPGDGSGWTVEWAQEVPGSEIRPTNRTLDRETRAALNRYLEHLPERLDDTEAENTEAEDTGAADTEAEDTEAEDTEAEGHEEP